MKRRTFFAQIGAAAAAWPTPMRAEGSDAKPLIGWVAGGTQANATRLFGYVKEGLAELGWVEGRNFASAARFAEARPERLPGLAAEMVRLKPALIVAGAVDAAVALKTLTATIPIVSAFLADAVHLGLIASNAHPGGNVTGITPYIDGLPAKQLELARQIVPGATRIGIIGNMNDPKAPAQRFELEAAARELGVRLVAPEVREPEDIATAMEALAHERVEVVIVMQTSMLVSERRQIAILAAAKRLPSIYGYREHVDDGGLVSYGVNMRWCCRRLATFVHKILNGASPADLPVEFPTNVEMVVNQKTARALGLSIPALLLSRADEVIE